ncbi:hypothetical protein [Nonomuraea africana]|uniref:hypothetical protein n=1 Tax=Nonomuraea africana TaxID=46171 RepID=UPI0033D4A525
MSLAAMESLRATSRSPRALSGRPRTGRFSIRMRFPVTSDPYVRGGGPSAGVQSSAVAVIGSIWTPTTSAVPCPF